MCWPIQGKPEVRRWRATKLAAMANSAARLLASATAPLSSRRSPASSVGEKAPRPPISLVREDPAAPSRVARNSRLIDGRHCGGEPGAILFRFKASDRARGEHSGNERSGRYTIAISRTGMVNTPSSTQETNTAADRSAVVGSGSVPRALAVSPAFGATQSATGPVNRLWPSSLSDHQ
jgi:hypothetical protein